MLFYEFVSKVEKATSDLSGSMSDQSAKLAALVAMNTGAEYSDFVYPPQAGESSQTTEAREPWTSGHCGRPGGAQHMTENSLLQR